MKEILIVSNYYPPEKGAAANRIEQLALELQNQGYQVTVVCPLPNYPQGKVFPDYKGKFKVKEIRDGIIINRLWVYPSVSKNLVIRLLSVFSFSLYLFFWLLIQKTPKKVIVQSPPLLLSFLSVMVLSWKKKKIILNVSDLWPMAALELKVIKKESVSYRFSLFMERFIYRKATLVLGQSQEIITHVERIVPEKECYLYRNFPVHNMEQLNLTTIEEKPITLFYAGLMGIAQGVFEMCQKINFEEHNIELHLFGDGAEKVEIETLIATKNDGKLVFHGMKNRDELHTLLKSFDVAVVPLKTRIYGSVPSKIFEYAGLGFPILYFGGGEGEDIVKTNQLGWVVPVENHKALNETITEISCWSKAELRKKKEEVFNIAKEQFDLHKQIEYLIAKNVF